MFHEVTPERKKSGGKEYETKLERGKDQSTRDLKTRLRTEREIPVLREF